MLLTTSPFTVSPARRRNRTVEYRPVGQRRIAPIDPEDEQEAWQPYDERVPTKLTTANNLRWPRPIIIPSYLVPRDFDDLGLSEAPGFGAKITQQSPESFLPVVVKDEEAERFNSELWSRPTYRFRCHAWSLWQRYLKDWWYFIRYPLAFGAALGYAIATIVHLARSHP